MLELGYFRHSSGSVLACWNMSFMWKSAFFGAFAFIAGLVQASDAINPDVTQANIQQTICLPGYTKTVRPNSTYTNGVKRKLLLESGIDESHMAEYELDHIIPLAVGGHPRKAANLQLQPWDGEDGAKRKDRIEVKLQCLVCTEQVSLGDAQREIADNWQAAYHKYAVVKCKRQSQVQNGNILRSVQH